MMMKVVTAAQMQALDRRTIVEARIPGTTLMERAGEGLVSALEARFGPVKNKRIAVLCGKGNNGGDGLVGARLLQKKNAKVAVWLLAAPAELSRDAAVMFRRLTRSASRSIIARFVADDRMKAALAGSDIVVDALLGTGVSSELTGEYKAAVEFMNDSRRPIVAVDIPSGIQADDGRVLGSAVRADLTVTFGLPKLGLYVGAGIDHAGVVAVADIGIPSSYADAVDSQIFLVTKEAVRRTLPQRAMSAHKGTFGHAGIIAGSVGKTGAAALAAQAALRTGAGLVTLAAPNSVNDVLEAKLLEVMTFPLPETKARTLARSSLDRIIPFMRARTAVALGPGLSTHPETVELVQSLMRHLDRPAVLDADALNALAGRASLLAESKTRPILTPHPGEMARLEPGATPQSVNADRIGTARHFAATRGVIVVLKGARTVIGRPDGVVAICPTGNPGMATAGTGDVLTGMLVGLLAQRIPDWDAACAATYLHGLAGDLAACRMGQPGLIARDVVADIPHAINTVTC
ncbi:MAG TPA: NAD(P)H-hydrate dehydratase [Nitrospira sp.]|nr:NAD(P)H-hydrate dehydratase [Nitrospira sp.]